MRTRLGAALGTTLTAMLWSGDHFALVHIGNSRVQTPQRSAQPDHRGSRNRKAGIQRRLAGIRTYSDQSVTSGAFQGAVQMSPASQRVVRAGAPHVAPACTRRSPMVGCRAGFDGLLGSTRPPA
jgi:hypothetical protein